MPPKDTLNYDVFVSDPIPQNVPGMLPNGEPHMFSPLSSTLIYGKNDAVLVDPPLTINRASETERLPPSKSEKLRTS